MTVSAFLQYLHLAIDENENPDRAQYEAEFNKLLPMLELRLVNYVTGVLVGTMFAMSEELGRREMTRPHRPYVAATLAVEAGSWRHHR
ncbi:hypothetical protein ENSA5_35680 [Enhygromyxa salina]|uniref:Uncharacterized protein n=1 Tax=Enhygromyxa salina TaxID=215803 RepID=A0A2S9XVD3_9BACT|nr:hypothetical protein [Enhygromyxa salina]PRP96794.1 hypothetical protein ENSA5_35680 [Enhygromyxa salina]